MGDFKLVHKTQTPKCYDPFGDIGYVPPNARFFSMPKAFHIYEDHEAVIKQINKSRSPAMRHISRTHRVSLWIGFVTASNADPMIKIKYVNATQQLADILTKGSFIGDRWTQLTLSTAICQSLLWL